jgi:PEP-CTERM/exosortase A-associated glycosyltransferase
MTVAPRILHVLDHSVPLHSGYAFRTLAILREQRRRGWETVHLTSTKHYGATAAEEEVEGLRFYRTSPSDSALSRLPVLNQAAVISDTRRRLDEVIARERPNVLHAHSPALNGVAAIQAGRRYGLPVVYEMRASWEDAAVDHGTTTEGSLRYRLSRLLETWVLRRADAVTTICEGLRQDILVRGIPAARVTVIPNAVDIERFPPITEFDEELRRRLGLEGAFVLGFLGSFYGYEGLELAVEAMPLIRRDLPNAKLLLVGGGREEPRLKEQVARLGLEPHVLLVGRVPHDEVERYYGLVDLLVYPRRSIRLTETVTPLKPLEAMAQGRLLIASDVGGHRELIRDGETGFLFAPDNAEALAGAVRRAVAARGQWDEMRRAGRRFVEMERSWSASVEGYRSVYGALLGAVAGAVGRG